MISVQQIIEEERERANDPTTAPVVTPEQNMQPDGSIPKGAIETRTAQYVDQLHRGKQNAQQEASNQSTDVIYDNKPSGLDDEQYAAIRSLGYTDEQITNVLNSPNPPQALMEGIFSKSYKNNISKPQVLDEKTMKRQRTFAGIGDALSLLSQMAGASQGARTRERKWEESATARLDANQKKIYERYLNESDKYNRGLVNMQMQDYLQGKQDWEGARKNMLDAIKYANEKKVKAADKAQKDAFEREKLEETKKNNKSIREKREHDMKMAEQNAKSMSALRQSQMNKNNAQAAGKASNLSGKKADVTFYLLSEDGDPNASLDKFNRPIVEYSLSKDEIFSLAQEAKKNKEFMERNGLILSQPMLGADGKPIANIFGGSSSYKYAPDDEIALAYIQEMYTNQYKQAQAGKSPFPVVTMPQLNGDIGQQDIWQDPLDAPSYEEQKIDENQKYINQFLLDN